MIYDYLTMFIFMETDITARTDTWSTMISSRYSEKNCFPLQLPSAGNSSVWGPVSSLAQLSFLNKPPCLMSKTLAQLVFYSFVLNIGTWFRLSNNLFVEIFPLYCQLFSPHEHVIRVLQIEMGSGCILSSGSQRRESRWK